MNVINVYKNLIENDESLKRFSNDWVKMNVKIDSAKKEQWLVGKWAIDLNIKSVIFVKQIAPIYEERKSQWESMIQKRSLCFGGKDVMKKKKKKTKGVNVSK